MADPGIPVVVEVLLFGVRGGELTYRTRHAALVRGMHPDDLARRLVPPPGDRPRAGHDEPATSLAVLHSTSWRQAGERLVLTYAALPDPDPDAATAPLAASDPVVGSDDPLHPAPAVIGVQAVAVHASRHLAWLRQTDEAVATALAALPAFWHALAAFPPGPAGALHPVPGCPTATR